VSRKKLKWASNKVLAIDFMQLKLCSSIYSFDRILTVVGLGSTRVDFWQTDASICGASQMAGIGAYKNKKNLCREV
jgi:hypothetical protein